MAVVAFATGALGDPFLADEVAFASIERSHFSALGVIVERGTPDDAPLVLRLNILGDAPEDAVDEAAAWLAAHANIALTRDPRGAPLFLTTGDLAATSGRGTLGATVSRGMAVEVRDPRIAPCVVAHEILHFVGLKHVPDRTNIMYLHCSKDFLSTAQLEDWQIESIAQVSGIRATTPGGIDSWASR